MFTMVRLPILVCTISAFLFIGAVTAEETPCQLQTLDQMADLMRESILKRFPDAQFTNEGVRFLFQGDFRDTSYYENFHSGHGETVGRFFSSNAGVGGGFSIQDYEPPPKTDGAKPAGTILSISSNGYDDGYFKNLKWSVSVPRFKKLFSAYVFYTRGTPQAFLDELVALSRFFGSCQALESFTPIDEAKAIELAKIFAVRDAVASEIIQHDPKVLDKNVPGRWNTNHAIIFRGGCCCACDGECDDIIVNMTSAGVLVDVKVKHWLCGGRNKRNVNNR